MALVADARAMSGLSQASFADRVGTSRTRLSAYENGHTSPELDTLERIARAARSELALVPEGTERVRTQYGRIHGAIHSGDRAWTLRLIAELVAWVRTEGVEARCLQQDPGLSGDRRWDALIGGVVEMLCAEVDLSVPAWASGPGRFLDELWFYSSLRSLWPYIFVTTPAALASRGVFLSADSLAST
jgi:transcriptional regulator with XRE-family HTH domain